MSHTSIRTYTGTLTITLTLLCWSSVPLFLRHFAESIDAWTSNGWRYGFAAMLWAPLLLVGHVRKRLPPGLWRAALVPSLVNAVGQVTFTCAHYKIDPGLLTFGLRSQVVVAAVGAYLLFPRERQVIRSRAYLVAVVLVLGGTAGAILLDGGSFDEARVSGVVLALVSGGLFAGYALAVQRYMSGFNSVIAFAVISQYTAAAMIALMLLFGDRYGLAAVALPEGEFLLLLLSAVIGIAIGHVLYYMSMARLGIAVSSGVLQLHPFLVGIASFYLFKEVLTVAQWTSGLLAVVGAVLMLGAQERISRRRLAQKDGSHLK